MNIEEAMQVGIPRDGVEGTSGPGWSHGLLPCELPSGTHCRFDPLADMCGIVVSEWLSKGLSPPRTQGR